MAADPRPEGAAPTQQMHRTSVREAAVLMVLAAGVGLASGLSAVILTSSVHGVVSWLGQWHGLWWMIAVPGIGAALSALFLNYLLKDQGGHGVPELIRAATVGGGGLQRRMIYSRLVSSFLTVGTGGTAGLEGPIATSGGAI